MNKFFIVSLVVILSGCTSLMTPAAISGSQSDRVVEFSYSYGNFIKPVVDWSDVVSQAGARCEARGYSNTLAFGGTLHQCNKANANGGCVEHVVTASYHCTD